MVQPSPPTTSPSDSLISGEKSMSAEAASGRCLDLWHAGRVIAVRVGDENMSDGLAADCVEQRADMRIIVGSGIEDRDLAATDDVTHRALVGERSGIVGDQRAYARRHLFGVAGHKIEALVERNFVAHAQSIHASGPQPTRRECGAR